MDRVQGMTLRGVSLLAVRGFGRLIEFLEPDGLVVGVEVAVGRTGGNVLNAVEVELDAIEAGDAEFGTLIRFKRWQVVSQRTG